MNNEYLSELVDGELDADSGAQVLRAVMKDPAQREACSMYWLIGDALRDSGQIRFETRLTDKVLAALEDEPVVLAPSRLASPQTSVVQRWLPAAAAVAGVAVAAWVTLSLTTPAGIETGAPAVMAKAPAASQARLALSGNQAYYMAHQVSAMGAPVAGVAQYVRTVSDERVEQP